MKHRPHHRDDQHVNGGTRNKQERTRQSETSVSVQLARDSESSTVEIFLLYLSGCDLLSCPYNRQKRLLEELHSVFLDIGLVLITEF